jgi:hypothetical protein
VVAVPGWKDSGLWRLLGFAHREGSLWRPTLHIVNEPEFTAVSHRSATGSKRWKMIYAYHLLDQSVFRNGVLFEPESAEYLLSRISGNLLMGIS